MAKKKISVPETREEARELLAKARLRFRRGKEDLDEEDREKVLAAIKELDGAIKDDEADISEPARTLAKIVHGTLHFARKSKFREYAESIGVAVFLALCLRAFVIELFHIPSGSMEPTLLVGDRLFVSKFAYGIRIPFTTTYLAQWRDVQRGDIIVFEFPVDEVNTQVKIGFITRGLEQYRQANGGFPPSLEVLEDPATGEELSEERRIDDWGNPFVYEVVDESFSLVSAGPDGQAGTGDDLTAENSAFYGGVDVCLDPDSMTMAKDYIKRVVGLPGDRVRMSEGIVYVNDEPIERDELQVLRRQGPNPGHYLRSAVETMDNGTSYTVYYDRPFEDFDEITVRDDHVFVMGDNRDHSSDGRCWGQVPLDNIKGRAEFILFSAGPGDGVRWSRAFDGIE